MYQEDTAYSVWIGLCNSARVNGTHIDWHKPIPETEEVISQQIDGFLTRFFCNRCFFLRNAKVDQRFQVLRYDRVFLADLILISFIREAPSAIALMIAL